MSAWDRVWPAPAKLNLFLHVVGRRADGYHLLQTVFRFIDLADTLRFTPRSDGRIVLATPTPGVAPEQDLVVRAAKMLKVGAGGTALGATIHLEKRIPMGGGLGGGSSDAATTLIALNRLWGLNLPRERLQEIGLHLGADVPVFIHGRNCFAEGVGERFTVVTVPDAWYLLSFPPVEVPTATIFRAPNLQRATPAIRPADWRPGFGHNDLEPVACALYPEVARHLAELRRFGDARMTGSGACCFVSFKTRAEAEQARQALPADFRTEIIRGLPLHPLAKLE
ncbi:4-(cytidine 5'-diphospho)-2-C-methyl-D-erythritol kinase [Sulfuricystis multivorans]|uniref:4-(cytidine 5'-diphospho)-2-C-methyl-D-erythritol kinase n=1 Tax=Sulfuricystis multivorans TaxID=2211108 RepID=UPI000F84D936|nr:4-(cytidine 5'-diphospho)-2-C-methyl-D-erythritol kinase [Sulfuricystis multivorans]